MKKLAAIMLFCCFCCSLAPAASAAFVVETTGNVNPAMGEFIFALDCYEDEYGMCLTKTITIREADSGREIQTISVSDFNHGEDARTFGRDSLELIIEDMNFDGFADIRIQAFTTAGPNIPYICWLWDKEKNQFVHDADLSEIASIEVDRENEWILSSVREGAAGCYEEIYRYIDGKLTLFEP